ncbi:MAG: hypothetical protein Kow0047_06760 [Anaerolineae bacterium]
MTTKEGQHTDARDGQRSEDNHAKPPHPPTRARDRKRRGVRAVRRQWGWILLATASAIIVSAWWSRAVMMTSTRERSTIEATTIAGDHVIVSYPVRLLPAALLTPAPVVAVWLESGVSPHVPPSSSTQDGVEYVLELRANHPGIAIVDEGGLPHSGIAVVTPAPRRGTPVIFYLAAQVPPRQVGLPVATPTVQPTSTPTATVASLTATQSITTATTLPAPAITPHVAMSLLIHLNPSDLTQPNASTGPQEIGIPINGADRRMLLWYRIWLFATDPISVAAALLAVIVSAVLRAAFDEQRRQREREEQRRDEWLRQLIKLQHPLSIPAPQAALTFFRELMDEAQSNQEREQLQQLWDSHAPPYLKTLALYWPLEQILPEEAASDCAHALLEIWQRFPEQREWAQQIMGCQCSKIVEDQKMGSEEKVRQLNALLSGWRTDRAALEALWSHLSKKGLPQRIEEMEKGQESKPLSEWVAQVKNDLKGTLRWPKLWDFQRPEDPPDIKAALESLQLKENPFGPLRAERDPRLPGFRYLKHVGAVATRRPTIVFGAPGTGKTASAMLLAQSSADPPRPFKEGCFPIWPVEGYRLDAPMDHESWLECVERATAACLVRLVAGNLWLIGDERFVRHFVGLGAWCYGSVTGLISALAAEGAAPIIFAQRLQGAASDLDHRCLPMTGRMRWLREAIPPGLDYAYLIIDLQVPPGVSSFSAQAISSTRALLDLSEKLVPYGIYLKAFVPLELKPHLRVDGGWDTIDLTWSMEDMRELLDNRWKQASEEPGAAFEAACKPGAADRFISLAAGNPRRLIENGNRLLQRLGQEKRSTVALSDLDALEGDTDDAS